MMFVSRAAEVGVSYYYDQLRTHKSKIEDWFELDLKRNALRWSIMKSCAGMDFSIEAVLETG